MPRRGLSMRSEGLACPQTSGHAAPLDDPLPAVQEECKRLQLLVGELVLKNHELRSEVARLRNEKQEFNG